MPSGSALESAATPQTLQPQSEGFRNAGIPRHGIALLQALRFSGADCIALQRLDDADWNRLLTLCDASQLTLLLGHLCRPFLPDWVRSRIDQNYSDNACRFGRLQAAVFELSESLAKRSIDFALLKGFAHSPALTPDPLLRSQGDIDVWCLPDRIFDAKEALTGLGYRPIGKSKGRHLDPMIRETSWEWCGDYYARDLPIPVDLHYQLWDADMECIAGPPEQELWKRRRPLAAGDRLIPALDPADAVAFAALHVMMHLLHGDVRLQRVWELAYILHNHSDDSEFWLRWKTFQPIETRQVQVVAFLLSDLWFGCGLPKVIAEEAESVSPDILLWIQRYGFSPVEALFFPNKDELWLNLCLVTSFRDKARVFARRLLPVRAAETRSGPGTGFLLTRARHHARTLPSTCFQGLKWWWLRHRLNREFRAFGRR